MAKIEVVSSKSHLLETKYTQLSTRFDPGYGILWTLMNPEGVPCYTLDFLNELNHHHKSIEGCRGVVGVAGNLYSIRYSVVASHTPGIFNLGGQLALFAQLIKNRDRQSLLHYATMCIDVMSLRMNHFNLPLTTISLIQGDALGGGFESALASDIIVAERSSKMGFPEILFNMFPGMGAYSFLARRIGSVQAEKMILSGKIYRAEELHELGLVDVLVEDGEGEDAVYQFVRKQSHNSNGFMAVQRARQRFNPINYQELIDITTIWADAALQLSDRDLKVMERLVRSQQKMFGQNNRLQCSESTSNLLGEMEFMFCGGMERRKTPRPQHA